MFSLVVSLADYFKTYEIKRLNRFCSRGGIYRTNITYAILDSYSGKVALYANQIMEFVKYYFNCWKQAAKGIYP